MSPLIPTPDTLPVPWGWFQFLLLLTFPLHLLLMNCMLGSTAVALYARVRGGESGRRLSYELAKVLPALVALTVNLGVAPLLFIQVIYGHFIYVSSILLAVFWLGVVPLLILAYYGAYVYDFRFPSLGRQGTLLLATILLAFLAIAFIYTNNFTLMLVPEAWTAYFRNAGGTVLNLGEKSLLPRYLHMVTGALAVGGLFVALFGRFVGRRDPEAGSLAERLGLNLFTALTLLQVLLGVWFLIALPREVMLLFMGGDLLATGLFLLGLALVLAAIAAGLKRRAVLAAWAALPLLVVMTLLRAYVRAGYLAPHFSLDQLQVVPQYSPRIFFFVVLAVGVAMVAWLLRQAVKAGGKGQAF